MTQLFACIIGASLGCIIRWQLSLRLNSSFTLIPPGTLLVNLLGGFIIGGALAWFLHHPEIAPTWRLLITTGLCGGLTTFSTFSVEAFTLLQTGNYIWAIISVMVHVLGSLAMTAAGFWVMTLL